MPPIPDRPDPQQHPEPAGPHGRIRTAEVLSIGTEIVVGETRDTNASELATALTAAGVVVGRITALPDHLDTVRGAFADGLARADLVVSTGGLGPTPDDLTREAIAAVCGEEPTADPGLEAWLRDLWARRDLPFPPMNRKQAWLIPSAAALANPNGTAPGWFVRPPGGGTIVALPGPPREMRPMWTDEAMPRLRAVGLGRDLVARTYRLTGIGESQVAERLGEEMLRATDPEVATYARADAVDVRVSAVSDGDTGSAEARVAAVAAIVEDRLGEYIWATGTTTWGQALDERLVTLGWRLATTEHGTHGALAALLAGIDRLALAMVRHADDPAAGTDDPEGTGDGEAGPGTSGAAGAAEASADTPRGRLLAVASEARAAGSADVGLALRARERGADMVVSLAIVSPAGEHVERRIVFLGGTQGRSRAALTAAAALLTHLRAVDPA
jgi:nicotinamide-nucleotide amidase